ncbi:hypothetical protein LCGC14_1510200 [marine sediment metagenome]|uniref:Uncharacterized protein n=1 Tax=marine sediment metagenome TaxID=412755 RepID=A0A0F9LH24_9ZZZZ
MPFSILHCDYCLEEINDAFGRDAELIAEEHEKNCPVKLGYGKCRCGCKDGWRTYKGEKVACLVCVPGGRFPGIPWGTQVIASVNDEKPPLHLEICTMNSQRKGLDEGGEEKGNG